MLIDINILVIEDIIMNFSQKITVIDSCTDIKISFTIMTKFISQISKIILVKQHTVILLRSNLTVAVIELNLSDSHDFLFESDCHQINTVIYAHIIHYIMTEMYVQNDNNFSLIIL